MTEQTALLTDAPPRRRARVLLSAFAFSPVRGSEPAVGWNIASRLAKYHDVTVFCSPGVQSRQRREEIDSYLARHGPFPGLTIHYVEPPAMCRLFQRDNQNGSLLRGFYYVGYAAWQRQALHDARRLHAEQPFDLAHHLNVVGYREPGYLWKLGIPFLWGPVGGASNTPLSYFGMLPWKQRIYYGFRALSNEWQKRTKLRCRAAARAAKHIWVIGQDNEEMVTGIWGRQSERMPETGCVVIDDAQPRRFDGSRPLRLAWSGRVMGGKCLPILLHAMARLKGNVPIELTVLGTGPELQEYQALVRHLAIDQQVHWAGQLPHSAAIAEMARADVFVFTGVQEATTSVVPEALSQGLPVICHDACGMGSAVTDNCGIKVPMIDAASSIEGFAQALTKLHSNPPEVERLSRGALRRAEELSWDNKAKQIAQTYDRILGPVTS